MYKYMLMTFKQNHLNSQYTAPHLFLSGRSQFTSFFALKNSFATKVRDNHLSRVSLTFSMPNKLSVIQRLRSSVKDSTNEGVKRRTSYVWFLIHNVTQRNNKTIDSIFTQKYNIKHALHVEIMS